MRHITLAKPKGQPSTQMHSTLSGHQNPFFKRTIHSYRNAILRKAKAARDPTGLCLQAQHLFVAVPMWMWYQTICPFNEQEMKRKKKL